MVSRVFVAVCGVAVLAVAGCRVPPAVQLCEAIAKRDVAAVRRLLAEHEFDTTIDQGGCVPAEVVFTAAPGDATLTSIGLELVKAGLPADASWVSRSGGGSFTAIETAAGNGNRELVRALLAVGLDTQSRDAGRALIRAAEAGHLPVVTLLIEEGVSPEVADGLATPLSRAKANGRDDVVRFLDGRLAALQASRKP